jgi:hypothetical protein
MQLLNTDWVYNKPTRVTFRCVHKAILMANKAPPEAKKMAWHNVYELSKQYQRQEDEDLKKKLDSAVIDLTQLYDE